MSPGRKRPKPQFRLVPGESRRAGSHWATLLAALRRGGMQAVPGDAAPVEMQFRVRASLECYNSEGILALFHVSESLKSAGALTATPDETRFVQALFAVAHAPVHERLALLDTWMLKEPIVVGELQLNIAASPAGLIVAVAVRDRARLRLLDGWWIQLQFAGGPEPAELIESGAAVIETGVALLESRGVERISVDLRPFGRLRLDPEEA